MLTWVKTLLRKRQVYRMGLGRVLIAYGTMNGKPCIVLDHAPSVGGVGADAVEYKEMLQNNGTVIVFETPESLMNFARKMSKADQLASKEPRA